MYYYVRPRTNLCEADNEPESGHEAVRRISHFRLVLLTSTPLPLRFETTCNRITLTNIRHPASSRTLLLSHQDVRPVLQHLQPAVIIPSRL